jgi:hypothetical protein
MLARPGKVTARALLASHAIKADVNDKALGIAGQALAGTSESLDVGGNCSASSIGLPVMR